MKNNSTKAIIESLIHDPFKWSIGENVITHNESNLQLWIGNGMAFIEVYSPFKYKFSFLDKVDIWSAIKYCKSRHIEVKVNI